MAASAKKAFALRLDPALFAAIERMAAAELRSANAEIEVLLREALAPMPLYRARTEGGWHWRWGDRAEEKRPRNGRRK
jgi:hypothetical protein